jgi:hypothetical protein
MSSKLSDRPITITINQYFFGTSSLSKRIDETIYHSGPPLLTIRLIERGRRLDWEVNSENKFLEGSLGSRKSYKRIAILICARLSGTTTYPALTQMSNRLVRDGFKKKTAIMKATGNLANKSRLKEFKRQTKGLNTLFNRAKLKPPIIDGKINLKWNTALDRVVIFTDTTGGQLDTRKLETLLSKYQVHWQTKVIPQPRFKRPKVEPVAPDKMDYLTNPSRESVQRQLENKKKYKNQY